MLNINKCKKNAKLLVEINKKQIDNKLLEIFNNKYNQVFAEVNDYQQKYYFLSIVMDLKLLKSFQELHYIILESQDLLLPLIVDQMLNDEAKNFDALLIYKAIYEGTDFIPNIADLHSYFPENGGESSLAVIMGCYWMEHQYSNGLLSGSIEL